MGSFYFTKIATRDNGFFNISTSDKEDACSGLISGKYDLIFFPFDNAEISKIDKLLFRTDMVKKYDLCLFMNKNNVFANTNDKDIGWEELKKMNIVPLGKSVAFNLYLSSLTPNARETTTTTLDILLIKNGIDNDLWIACLGEEFFHFCDKKKTVIKRIRFAKNLNTEINWFFCYKQMTNVDKTKKIKKIIDIFNKMFLFND